MTAGGRVVHNVVVKSAAEAVASLSSSKPLMAIVDPALLISSVAEGRSLSQLLKAVPVVLLAADDTHAEHLEACHRLGAADCILRPLRVEQIMAKLSALFPAVAPAGSARAVAGREVLLIEDDEALRNRLQIALEVLGLSVTARAGTEAEVNKPLANRPDLTLVGHAPRFSTRWLNAHLGATTSLVSLFQAAWAGGSPVWFPTGTFTEEQVLANVQAHFRLKLDLRAHQRTGFFSPVELREHSAAGAPNSAYSYMLTPGGLFVRSLSPPRLNASVDLKIYLTTGRQVLEGTGVVVWTRPYRPANASTPATGGAGIQFLGMSPKKLAQLREICVEMAALENT